LRELATFSKRLRAAFPSAAPKALRIVWDKSVEELVYWLRNDGNAIGMEEECVAAEGVVHVLPEEVCLRLLGYLYYRLGRDCGTIGR
jgi:hypothetical protein